MTTLGFRHHLVASAELKEGVVTDFTRLLFNMRPSLAIDVPGANRIEAPDTERGARIPAHPGAAAYIDGEERTFLDTYGDWLYYGILGFGVLGSLFGWLIQAQVQAAHAADRSPVDEILALLKAVRDAPSVEELDRIEQRADELFVRALHVQDLDDTRALTFWLASERVGHALLEQRQRLTPAAAPGASEIRAMATSV
jgi:hypothetical protein